ncbi:MAG TPA: pyrroline-5-carboxylate reductase [Candidatus Limnocylindrales bacterium]|nr:pyrroline-5-carboxylate reductase [Candidatus Limnocylindrales bacterium]
MKSDSKPLAILGSGNIGTAIADGIAQGGQLEPADILLTRRKSNLLASFRDRGFSVLSDNSEAVRRARLVLVAVGPQQIDALLAEISPHLRPDAHTLISVVSGVTIAEIKARLPAGVRVVRAMPNTAIAIRESMTCLASDETDREAIDVAQPIFGALGRTLVLDEDQMIAATALGACGIAFFLRAIRAASQGGIEIGLHTDEALLIAAQTARGAASLLLTGQHHPEGEIDRVTTPRGCTIAGLNRMEHEGFSSAMIRGIVTSAEKAAKLYSKDQGLA